MHGGSVAVCCSASSLVHRAVGAGERGSRSAISMISVAVFLPFLRMMHEPSVSTFHGHG